VLGKGLGWSQQKLLFLPEAHTDFIFPIIGEEFGLWGTALVVLLFAGLLYTGVRVARSAPDVFGSALAFGITMMISVQAAFNIAVTTKVLPTKGISLPFVSFGGSSMLFTLAAVGILVNVARHAVATAEEPQTDPSALRPARQEAAG
jgi:cell division protein FtsW